MEIVRRVNGRLFRITISGVLVDCRDVLTGFESQAILDNIMPLDSVLADSQVRDAIRSAYYNATSRESGRYPVGGDKLPDDFTVDFP